ncbi:pali-domain-containing protein [Clavulina sp. PMI_390]|nr:pali-domain-containing protein [Clavulina sp. PMI_390]
MVATAAAPTWALSFVAMVLLIVVSVSTPIVEPISFLTAHINGRTIHFGEYGYTGRNAHTIGYSIDEQAIGLSDKVLNLPTITNLTKALVIHTIAAVIVFIAFLQGACATINYSRIHTILAGFTMSIALFFVTIAFAVDLILFDLVAERIRADGYQASLGPATWITLAALIVLVLGCMSAVHGTFGNYHDGRYRERGHREHRRRRRRSYDSEYTY